ncbi:MAG: sel1 repeat family protein, partial [Desulfovibrionaceae bacterium]|nr:sel1 repeat family protein [Desulfovibrionaceae bacterium]
HNLGIMYFEGRGVPRNSKQAISWWQKAAEQNYAEAQFYLGMLSERGNGLPLDKNQALAWYGKAAEQNHELAKKALNRLKK